MNRAERRRTNNKRNKLNKKVAKLTPQIAELIEIQAKSKFNDYVERFQTALDLSISAKLVELIPELTLKEIFNINENIGEMAGEFLVKESKLLERAGGDIKMAKKMMKDIKGKVKERAEKLIKEEIKQNEAIKILVNEFKEEPKSALVSIYKEVKEEIKEFERVEQKIKDHKEIIFESKEEEAAAKEILNIIDEGKEEKTMNNTSKLKIKRMEIEGENGTYLVEDGKVKLTGDGQVIEFKNKGELEKYRKEEMEKFEKRIAEFREVFGMVN